MKQIAFVVLGTLILSAPLSAAPPAPDEKLLARWPQKAGAEEINFDGGQFLALTPAPDTSKGDFSVAVWVNANDLAGGNGTYGRGIARSTRGELVGDWVLAVHPDGRLRFCNWRKPGDDLTGSHTTRDPVLRVDGWYHVAATWDGKTNRLFVNGAEAAYTDGTTATGWGPGHEVGRSWTEADYYWDGLITELRVHGRVLTPAEIKKAAQSPPQGPATKELAPAGDPKVSAGVDRIIGAKLQEHKLQPAPTADDATFLRRVTLDLAGRVPTRTEADAFLADPSADKRHKVIDSLMGGREMPMYWAQVLSNWVMPREGRRDLHFVGYLRNSLAKGRSWDRMAREMLVARPAGSSDQYATYFLSYRLPALKDNSIARDVGRAFFGVNLRCAQCHDHPHVPEWTRERFLGLSAFFARTYEHPVTLAPNQKIIALGEKALGELEYTGPDGKKKPVRPLFLDGQVVPEPPADSVKEPSVTKNAPPPVPPFSRREALARVALDGKSPHFKRAMVNRVWRQLMGRGLVEPVDMMHEDNPPTHPELLDLLADDFASHGFDLRRLIAVIVQSEAYARSSRWPGPGDPPNEALHARAILRPLDADQLALSLSLATGSQDQFEGPAKRTVAQVRSAVTAKEVLVEFEPQEDEFEPTASQALFLLNSEYVQKNFVGGSGLTQSLIATADDAALARRAYLSILSRLPSPDETALVSRYLKDRGATGRAEACRELVWALLSGPEFRFNH